MAGVDGIVMMRGGMKVKVTKETLLETRREMGVGSGPIIAPSWTLKGSNAWELRVRLRSTRAHVQDDC